MSLMLDKDESFSMSAYVETSGFQRVVLSGYLVDRRADGTYIAPLIPQLFFGANGTQLQTWRQDIPTTGSQVILSRSGGQPSVPREDLWWRKVESREVATQTPQVQQAPVRTMEMPSWVVPALIIGGTLVVAAFVLWKHK